MKKLHDISLKDLLPENLNRDETVSRAAEAIDPHLRILAGCARLVSVFARLDELTSAQLDHLAVQFHVAVWNSLWDRDKKLAVIKATIETKRRRGTLLAVKEAIATIASPFEITEWWQQEPKGEPYTFGVTIPLDEIGKDLTAEEQEELFDLIYEAKSIRSHGTVTLKRCFETPIEWAGAMRFCTYLRLTGEAAPIPTRLRICSGANPTVYTRLTAETEPIETEIKLKSQAASAVYVRL